mgnify:CR=1 FL=1
MSDSALHHPRRRTLILVALAAVALIGAMIGWKTWHDTLSDPAVRRTSVILRDMSPGAEPVTVALISDIHVAGPDMPPKRLERIVAQINALGPDAILIAGDLVSEKGLTTHIYQPNEAVAPLSGLTAPLGVYLVPGNHDHWYDWPGLKAELAETDITVLENEAAQAGPLVIGGLDDEYTGHEDIPKTLVAMDAMEGGRIFLSHGPDPLPDLPNGSVILAGHTHCGQVQLPLIGMVFTQSRYGTRFACGRTDDPLGIAIVGAGLGTSGLPVRYDTQPEIWLIELRPPEGSPTAANSSD